MYGIYKEKHSDQGTDIDRNSNEDSDVDSKLDSENDIVERDESDHSNDQEINPEKKLELQKQSNLRALSLEKNENWNLIDENTDYNGYFKADRFPMASHLPQQDLNDHNPYQLFQLFYTEELFQHIADASNHNKTKLKVNTALNTMVRKMRDSTRPFTSNEFKVFMGICLMMNLNRNSFYWDHWNSKNDLKNSYLRFFMPKYRFYYSKRFFHVEDFKHSNKADKMHKLSFLIEYICEKWQKYFYPGRDICIDETIIPYTGKKTNFTVGLRNKPNSGFLMYGIANSTNGYMLKGEIFTGKDVVPDKDKKESNIIYNRILRLIDRYLDKGHILFVDNFYTTIGIADFLYRRNTGFVGTLRDNRAKEQKLDKGMVKSEVRYFVNQERPFLMLTIFYDTVIVKALSNCFKAQNVVYKKSMQRTTSRGLKVSPLVFREYNKKASGVDISNHLYACYRNTIRSNKWWHYIYFYFLQTCVTNAYLIYKFNSKDIRKTLIMPRKRFMLFIIWHLLYANGEPKLDNKSQFFKRFELKNTQIEKQTNPIPHCLEYSKLDDSKYQNKKAKAQACKFCKKSTLYCCRECGDGVAKFNMCMVCFEEFHLKKFDK